jgi:4a-hydroxytetrahydrobiopterin dehydratase
MDLTKKKCIPCEGGIPPLEKNESDGYLKHIQSGWSVSPANILTREFHFADFSHVMDFVNQVAALAEEEGHHPVIHVSYSKVVIDLWTHAIGGLSENDFILAAKIEKLY